jgi:extracellular elastinolytic metalloproteinase
MNEPILAPSERASSALREAGPVVQRGRRGIPGATRATVIAATIALLSGLIVLPAPALGAAEALGGQEGLGDLDARTAVVRPTAAQRQIASGMHAAVTWNAFGTPHSLIRYGNYLASGLKADSAAKAARNWLSSHRTLFRLSSAGTSQLELVNDSQLVGSRGHAVLFRQKFGGLTAVQDGMVTLGVVGSKAAGWKIAYVSSTLAGSQAAPTAATISAKQAWVAAAQNAGMPGVAADITKEQTEADWTTFTVSGYAQLQRARLRALAIPGQGVRAVYEVDVLNVIGGDAKAYVTLVDARNKKVWFRQNRVDNLAADKAQVNSARGTTQPSDAPTTQTFSGATLPGGACGPLHSIGAVPSGTFEIDVVASATIPADDIVLKLINTTTSTTVSSADSATSPEAIRYAPDGGVPPATYAAQVCPFGASDPFDYSGFWVTQDSASAGVPYPPEWKYFLGNPKLDYSNTDDRKIGCWVKVASVAECDFPVKNIASRSPWDFLVSPNSPSFTSIGNNAKTAEAWLSPLTPGENYSPPQPDRKYIYPWTNQWYTSKCDPTSFASPARNDIDASIINLFAGHNRAHDFSYFLGFTEQNYNAQLSNLGNGAPGPFPGREADPELGNVQAGAVTGGAPSYQGRDNANQITLQDGVAPITNQYLFQPIAGSFYAPCVDGGLDLSVYFHEYTHLISNRMAGGPDSSLTGDQAGAMGESWSDLNALEYMHAYGISYGNGANDWALGPYATGNLDVGIRNYALNKNPLNLSDIGYDSACNNSLIPAPIEPDCVQRSEVHSDGEIWNAVNYDIRQALVTKYNSKYPASSLPLQARCADGVLPADKCPGNRRWIQLVFDAWLLMPPDVTMLGARDAMLAADLMRFGTTNQKTLWKAFAGRGFGIDATTVDTDDIDPVASWKSPLETSPALRFTATDENHVKVNATIYVGKFEAAVTPAADTDPTTPKSDTMSMVPGKYDFIATAPGYGAIRFSWTVKVGGTKHVALHFVTNWASSAKGGAASGDGGNFADLIDDTENTDWAVIGATPNVVGKAVTVDLGGDAHIVDRVQVSAMLHPIDDQDDYDFLAQNRFTALRSFDIQTCNAGSGDCALPTSWTTVGHFVNAFKADIPRPLMPNQLIKSFDVTNTQATHVRLVVLENQCIGNPAFAGEQDNDPTNDTDCQLASARDQDVRVAELQVFSGAAAAAATQDPVVVLTADAAATATPGTAVTVNVGYQNLGPAAASNPTLKVKLPDGVSFTSADGGTWNATDRTIRWNLPTLAAGASGSKSLVMQVDLGTSLGTTLLAQATLKAPKTFSNPAWSVTIVQ